LPPPPKISSFAHWIYLSLRYPDNLYLLYALFTKITQPVQGSMKCFGLNSRLLLHNSWITVHGDRDLGEVLHL
jgi:hypothetical protein